MARPFRVQSRAKSTVVTTRTFLNGVSPMPQPPASPSRASIEKLALRRRARMPPTSAPAVLGELFGRRARIAGRSGDHGGLDRIEFGEGIADAGTILEDDTLADKIGLAPYGALRAVDIFGAQDDTLAHGVEDHSVIW